MTPYSYLHYRLLDHSTFRKDPVIGEKRLSLYDVLGHYSGRCDHLEVTLDLMTEAKHDSTPVKVGDLITLLHGIKVDMASCPPESTPRHTSPLGKFYTASILYFG